MQRIDLLQVRLKQHQYIILLKIQKRIQVRQIHLLKKLRQIPNQQLRSLLRLQLLNIALPTNLLIFFRVFEHIQKRRVSWFEFATEITELGAGVFAGFEITDEDAVVLVFYGDGF